MWVPIATEFVCPVLLVQLVLAGWWELQQSVNEVIPAVSADGKFS